MADLSRIAALNGGRDRGQLLLVAAFLIAATFVALAFVLNTAIYTENLATRSETVGDADAVEYRQVIREASSDLIQYVNTYNDTDQDDQVAAFRDGIGSLDHVVRRQQAGGGRVVGVEVIAVGNGTRIVQNESTRDFSNAVGTANWTLATDVADVRRFEMTVSRADLGNATTSDRFTLNVTNSDTWSMGIYDDGGNVTIEITNSTGSTTCAAPAAPDATIDLINGTIGGNQCDALRFGENVSPPYDLTYSRADQVAGNYSADVLWDAGTTPSGLTGFNTATSSDSPRVSYFIYEGQLRVRYVSTRLEYDGTVRVTPGDGP